MDANLVCCQLKHTQEHKKLASRPHFNYLLVIMVKAIRAIATAFVVSAASAFTPVNVTPLSHTVAPARPLSPPLHASSSATVLASATVLDKPAVLSPAERTVSPAERRRDYRRNSDMDPNGDYILRIYNDNINTREYVAVCLVQVVGCSEMRAYHTMQDAHHNGIAKVGEYNQEIAECYEEQLNDRGIMCDVVDSNTGWE